MSGDMSGILGGSTSPAAMSTAAGGPVIAWGLRAAVGTGRADGRRPRFRMGRAAAVAHRAGGKGH
jgi:hypothetical protein